MPDCMNEITDRIAEEIHKSYSRGFRDGVMLMCAMLLFVILSAITWQALR